MAHKGSHFQGDEKHVYTAQHILALSKPQIVHIWCSKNNSCPMPCPVT